MFSSIIDPIVTSLLVAFSALALVALCAIPVAYGVGSLPNRVQRGVDTLATVPMVFPPTVIGFVLLWVLGRNGPIGALSERLFGSSLVFTSWAAVLAASVVAFPLVYRSARSAFSGVEPTLKDAARTFGLGGLSTFWRVSLPLARRGVLSGLLLGFARALGEFGATLIVAGNIPGKTQTLPLAIYEAVQAGNAEMGWILCVVAAATGCGVLLLAERFQLAEGR